MKDRALRQQPRSVANTYKRGASVTDPTCCPYCGAILPKRRQKACIDGPCRKAFNNDRQKAFQRQRRAEDGVAYGHDRHTFECSMCGRSETSRHRHTTTCALCQRKVASKASAVLGYPGASKGAAKMAENARLKRLPVPFLGPKPFVHLGVDLPIAHPARQDWQKSTGLTFVFGRCRRCGEAFMAATGNGVAAYCSMKCGRADGKDRRRVKGSVSPVKRWQVFERDRWICQLCGRLIWKKYRSSGNHPFGPTVDHIIPVAHDGDHDESNLQAAHRQCNSKKGTDAVGSQLRLAV